MKHCSIFMFVRLFISILFLFSFAIEIKSQNYTSKYNSLYERYEYFDSNGKLIGYKKWNSLYNRWEYTDKSQNRSQKKQRTQYESPYDLELLQGAMEYKQKKYDHNLNLIYDKLDEIYEVIDNVVEIRGELSSQEKKEVSDFEKQVNEVCRCDLSETASVRKIILWLNDKKRNFQSWGKSSKSKSAKTQSNTYMTFPQTVYFKSSVLIWDSSIISEGKKIGETKGAVKVLEKMTEQCYKVEFNGAIGYIYGSLNR